MSQKSAFNNICDCRDCITRTHSIFCSLKDDEAEIFNTVKSFIAFRTGELIFKQGGVPFGLFILFQGKVKISKTGNDGRELIVRLAKEGDIIGYRALLGEDNYFCSATAIDNVQICFIPKDSLFKLIAKSPDIAFKLMKIFAADLRKAESNSTALTQKQVRQRVAEALLLLKEIYAFEADGFTLNIKLTREEFASIAGTVRETATKLLSEFKSNGLIELDNKRIKILDLIRLREMANGITSPVNHH
jgi:CRP/FNR family transcriptional regulator